MSPNDFAGSASIDNNRYGWYVSYVSKSNATLPVYYFYKNDWHKTMGTEPPFNYFATKETALDEFFEKYPNEELFDVTTAETLKKKKQETWRDRPPML